MKKDEHIEAAKSIGNDSWELINYSQLPKNASAARQVKALEDDLKWLEDHQIEISSRINYLIDEIS